MTARFLLPGSDAVAFGKFELTGVLDVPAKIQHTFVDFGPESAGRLQGDVLEAAADDQVALLSWEPKLAGRPTASLRLLRRIAAGDRDAYLAEAARGLRDTEQPVLLRFAPEMDHETDVLHPWAGQPPELFIRAWRRVHRVFQEERASNVRFAWTPGGYFVNGVFEADRWYPGDAYVDLVGFTAYAYWGWEEQDPRRAVTHTFRSPAELILPRYEAIRKHGKPVIIPELGIALHESQRAQQVVWLRELVDLIDSDLKDLSAVVYFHSPHNFSDFDIDWRLTPAEQQALAQRLARSNRIELALPSD